jgi:predicted GNAT superfamily acetyltransferase
MRNGMVKNNISYKTIEGIPDGNTYQELAILYTTLFKDADLEFFKQRINGQLKALYVLAYSAKILIEFKIGYPYNKHTFYSWVGGVHPKFRKQGIAKQLAKLQENYAKNKGFTKLRTKSMNQFKPMMILNLKNGFDIVNIYTNTKRQTKIVFEKLL